MIFNEDCERGLLDRGESCNFVVVAIAGFHP